MIVIEVAVVVTDKDFIPLDDGVKYLIHSPLPIGDLIQKMPDVYVLLLLVICCKPTESCVQRVRDMHKKVS